MRRSFGWNTGVFFSGLALPTGIAPFGNPADGGGWDDNGQRSNGLFAALHFSSAWLFLRPPNASALFEYVAETLAFWEDYLVKVDAEFAESHGLVEGESSSGVHSSGLHCRHLGCILLGCLVV